MATKPAKKTTKAKKSPKAVPATDAKLSSATSLANVRRNWPALEPASTLAFDALADDATRALWGGKTKAPAVLAEGVRWAVSIDKALHTYPKILEHYSAQRFAFFLDRLGRLDLQLRLDAQTERATQSSRTGESTAHEEAMALRDKLEKRLKRFAGQRDLLQDIAEKKGTAESSDALATGLRGLAGLMQTWLELVDPISEVLKREAGLSPGLIAQARAQADALTDSTAATTEAGPLQAHDSQKANIAEGGVLLEMKAAMDSFDDARDDEPSAPRLNPGPGTKAALDPGHRTKADAETPKA